MKAALLLFANKCHRCGILVDSIDFLVSARWFAALGLDHTLDLLLSLDTHVNGYAHYPMGVKITLHRLSRPCFRSSMYFL